MTTWLGTFNAAFLALTASFLCRLGSMSPGLGIPRSQPTWSTPRISRQAAASAREPSGLAQPLPKLNRRKAPASALNLSASSSSPLGVPNPGGSHLRKRMPTFGLCTWVVHGCWWQGVSERIPAECVSPASTAAVSTDITETVPLWCRRDRYSAAGICVRRISATAATRLRPEKDASCAPAAASVGASAGSKNRNSLCAGTEYPRTVHPTTARGAHRFLSRQAIAARGRNTVAIAGYPWVRFQCQGCEP